MARIVVVTLLPLVPALRELSRDRLELLDGRTEVLVVSRSATADRNLGLRAELRIEQKIDGVDRCSPDAPRRVVVPGCDVTVAGVRRLTARSRSRRRRAAPTALPARGVDLGRRSSRPRRGAVSALTARVAAPAAGRRPAAHCGEGPSADPRRSAAKASSEACARGRRRRAGNAGSLPGGTILARPPTFPRPRGTRRSSSGSVRGAETQRRAQSRWSLR
jgi:hypothetical protein